MEIRTCEEYVLQQLKDAREEIESLKMELEDLRLDNQALRIQYESLAAQDNVPPQRCLFGDEE